MDAPSVAFCFLFPQEIVSDIYDNLLDLYSIVIAPFE